MDSSPRKSRKRLILQRIEERRTTTVGDVEWAALAAEFAPISEPALRNALRASGLPLTPLAEGIRQNSLEELDRTLLAMLDAYQEATEAGDRERARRCRRLVITAKDHARLSLRRATPEKAALKQEMILRMLTWLENPRVFPDWLELRHSAIGGKPEEDVSF